MDVSAAARELGAAGEPFALVTVVWRRAPSSGKPGSRAIVRADGEVIGWMGGACAAPSLVEEALAALAEGRPRLVVLGREDDRPDVVKVAMACASEGAMEVFVEPVLPAPRMFVVGESPMTATLKRLAEVLGWRVSVVTDLPATDVGPGDYVVVATQGHYDEQALLSALRSPASYIGLVASSKRAAAVVEWLRRHGLSDDDVARLEAPAGLDLGPLAHEEIAVAVLADLVGRHASNRPAAIAVAAPEMAVDPVCGMQVAVAGARWTTTGPHGMIYFCSAMCLDRFEGDPAAFAG